MRKLILMTSAAIIAPLSGLAEDITCTATPNCADLGYTSTTSCDKGVKCPWGEAWFCPPEKSEVCEIGSILYSDMTCYKEAKAGKTPIGVVIYVDGNGVGQAIALTSIGKYQWSTLEGEISEAIPRFGWYGTGSENFENVTSIYDSCKYSKIIVSTGDKISYPAAWAAHEYSTEGTTVGDWCLPAPEIFDYYGTNPKYEIINDNLEKVGGKKLDSQTKAWSALASNQGTIYYVNLNITNAYGTTDQKDSYDVRPVFEFFQTFEGICNSSQQYMCKQENETGGVGNSCVGRYSECSCAEGYMWTGTKCELLCETGTEHGYILYSDMTRSAELDSTKTPIGIVVCSYRDGGGQAMALKSLAKRYKWSSEAINILELSDYESPSIAIEDISSCENSKIIMAAGDNADFPAAWAVNEYSTEGTSAGDWCLPAAGVLASYHNHRDTINSELAKVGGSRSSANIWSSTELGDTFVVKSSLSEEIYPLDMDIKFISNEVRPVIEF